MKLLRTVACAAILAAGVTGANAGGVRGSVKDYDRPFSWTGFYIGALASFNSGSSTHCDNGVCGPDFPTNKFEGGMAGITAGYNKQYGKVVVGIEVDWSWGDVSDSAGSTGSFNCGSGPCITELKSLGTVRARLGYAFDRVLPYVTAGVAFSDYHVGITPFVADHSVTSFTGGAGVEYAFSKSLTAKIEYLYVAGDDRLDYPTCGAAPNNCFLNVDEIHSVRMGLNYKF